LSLGGSLSHSAAIRIQIGLNVAVSASSLCINRRLYKIATAKVVVVTDSTEKRRAVFIDLLIGLGIPILQIIIGEPCPGIHSQLTVNMTATEPAYVVSARRYIIYEDFGPYYVIMTTLPA